VLGRAGVLVDPADLVYALGGYTYGRFEAFGTGFGLNGATIGAGWEREIVAGWKLRGEYRYTKFQSTDVTQTFVTNSTTVSATASTTNTNVTSQTDHISADMHSLWLGMVYDFGN
jgi:opacity protein-like surface antigen